MQVGQERRQDGDRARHIQDGKQAEEQVLPRLQQTQHHRGELALPNRHEQQQLPGHARDLAVVHPRRGARGTAVLRENEEVKRPPR